MAITVAASNSGTAPIGGASDLYDYPLPPSLEGDVMLVAYADNAKFFSPDIPAGWTSVHYSDDNTPDCYVFLKVMGPEPDTTFPVLMDINEEIAVIAIAFRGVDITTPQDVTATSATGTGDVVNVPSLTTLTDNACRVAFGFLDDDETTSTLIPGWTAKIDQSTEVVSCFLHYLLDAGPTGSEEAPTMATQGDDDWQAVHMALRPDPSLVAAPAFHVVGRGMPFGS